MVKIAALSLSLILWGCSKIDSIDAPTAISNIQVTDVGSDGDAQFCREFKLKDAEVASYFEKPKKSHLSVFMTSLTISLVLLRGLCSVRDMSVNSSFALAEPLKYFVAEISSFSMAAHPATVSFRWGHEFAVEANEVFVWVKQ